jgi:hypothetical protein
MIKALALNRVFPNGFLKTHHRVINPGTKIGARVNNQTKTSSFRAWLGIGLVAANAVLLLSYIYGVNQFASQGYQISVLQKRINTLSADNKQLNLKIAQATSMVSIQNDFLSSGYILAATPQFLQTDNLSLK